MNKKRAKKVVRDLFEEMRCRKDKTLLLYYEFNHSKNTILTPFKNKIQEFEIKLTNKKIIIIFFNNDLVKRYEFFIKNLICFEMVFI